MSGDFSTLPEMLHNVSKGAFNRFQLSIPSGTSWKSINYSDFYEQVLTLAAGLVDLGVARGDTVGLIAPSSPSWLLADLAIIHAGGVNVPFFIPVVPAEFEYKCRDAGIRYLIILDPAVHATLREQAANFAWILTGDFPCEGENVFQLSHVLQRGSERRRQTDTATMLPSLKQDDIYTIIYTSGSEGTPKGVVLTHGNILSQIRGAAELFPLDPEKDRAFSCLPLPHSFERMVVYYYLSCAVPVYFADDIQNAGTLIPVVRPTAMTVVPRLLEKIYSRMKSRVAEKKGPARWLAMKAMEHARSDRGASRSPCTLLFERLVYRRMRAALGGCFKYLICGGAPLAMELGRFFKNLGLPLYEGYGLTEASPVICANFPGHVRIGSVGLPFPGVTVRISPSAELLARGPGIMRGYHQQNENTRAVIDQEGFLHTGDLAAVDGDGFVTITGRIKEMYKTSGGKYVCPVPLEQKLCESRLVNLAMVIGEGRKFVSCLLFPDFDSIKIMKEKSRQSQLSDTEFLKTEAVAHHVQKLLGKANAGRSPWEQIRKYCFVLHAPGVESGELTPTMKLRRHVILEKHKDLIEAMYREPGQGGESP